MAGSPEDGDGCGGTEFRNNHSALSKKQIFSQIEIFSADEFRLCPEVRVCGFGSSPRFGDELMEIGVAAGRSVALGKCGIGECCSVVSEGWDGNWWIPCIIQPPDHPETKGNPANID